MNRILSALVAGLIFGLGIALSGMGNPAKVLNFFDPFGTWDPSLALVMGGALLTTAIGYRVIFDRRQAPLFDTKFHLPTARFIDARLVGGSALFGVGWGISGFCPGGAIPALGLGELTAWIFVGTMLAGIFTARTIRLALEQRATKTA